MLQPLLAQLTNLATDFWAFGVGVLLILASLLMLYRAIQGTTALGFGSGQMAAAAVIGIVGILIIVMAAFKVIPSFADILRSSAPPAPFK